MLESSLIALSLQIIVALAILNVWFLRSSKQTKFRGSDARTLSEEFENYGLSKNVYVFTSVVKPMIAIMLLIAIFFPFLTKPSVIALSLFMLGAVYMHFKVRDTFVKYIPALSILCGCVAIFALS